MMYRSPLAQVFGTQRHSAALIGDIGESCGAMWAAAKSSRLNFSPEALTLL
jgi:hypothetical protein